MIERFITGNMEFYEVQLRSMVGLEDLTAAGVAESSSSVSIGLGGLVNGCWR